MQDKLTDSIRELKRYADTLLAARVLSEPGADFQSEISSALHISSAADDIIRAIVQQARDRGTTWQAIGDALGVSRQSAFQRYGRPTDPRTGGPMNTIPLAGAAELAQAVIYDLVNGKWELILERCDSAVRANLSADALAAAWTQIVGASGDLESQGEPQITRAGDVTVTNTSLSMEAGDYVARISFRDDRTIGGLHILAEPAT